MQSTIAIQSAMSVVSARSTAQRADSLTIHNASDAHRVSLTQLHSVAVAPPESVAYREPRINDVWFQARIPDLVTVTKVQQSDAAPPSEPDTNNHQPTQPDAKASKGKSRKAVRGDVPPVTASQTQTPAPGPLQPVQRKAQTSELVLAGVAASLAEKNPDPQPRAGPVNGSTGRLDKSLTLIRAPSALHPPPEVPVWDPQACDALVSKQGLADYIAFTRSVECGQNQCELRASYRSMRASWGVATGGFSTDPITAMGQANSGAGTNADALPAECDNLALEHLARCSYDVGRARLLLTAWLGANRELATFRRLAQQRNFRDGVSTVSPTVANAAGKAAVTPFVDQSESVASASPMEQLSAALPGDPGAPVAMAHSGALTSVRAPMAAARPIYTTNKKIDTAPPVAGGPLNLGHNIGLINESGVASVVLGLERAAGIVKLLSYTETESQAYEIEVRSQMPSANGSCSVGADMRSANANDGAISSNPEGAPALRAPADEAVKTETSQIDEVAVPASTSAPQWKEWLTGAQKVLIRNSPPWDALVSLRTTALALPKLGGTEPAEMITQVGEVCKQLGIRLRNAVKWRAKVRDALCGTLNMRGCATCSALESLMGEYNNVVGVDIADALALQGITREARAWLRGAEDLLQRIQAFAGAAASVELLFFEDSANAGPGEENLSLADAQDASSADTSIRPIPARNFRALHHALATADTMAAPVSVDEALDMLRDADRLPVNLNPLQSDLQARTDRAQALATSILEHFPYPPGNYRGIAGNRVVQGFGLSKDNQGSAAILAIKEEKERLQLACGSKAASATSSEPVLALERDIGDRVEGTGSMADGSVNYVTYLTYQDVGYGSRVNAILGSMRRGRMPLCHLEALAKDVRDVGLVFAEGELLKAVHLEVTRWLGRTHEAVASRKRAPVAELRELLADAEGLPVDLSQRVAVLHAEIERARRWTERVRQLVPRGGQRTRKAGESKSSHLPEVRSMLNDVADGIVSVSVEDASDARALSASTEDWIRNVRAALDKSTAQSAEDGRQAGIGTRTHDENLNHSVSSKPSGPPIDVSMQTLASLLSAADDIPVAMEEYDLLVAEVAARKWAAKARKSLTIAAKVRVDTLKDSLKEIVSIRDKVPMAGLSGNGGDAGTGTQVTDTAEDVRRAIRSAESWMARVKKLSTARDDDGIDRRCDVRRLRSLVEEAAALPVNVAALVRPLEGALVAVEKWCTAAAPMLQRIRDAEELTRLLMVAVEAAAVDDSEGATKSPDARPDELTGTALHSRIQQLQAIPRLSMSEARSLLEVADTLFALPDGLRELRNAVAAAQMWHDRAANLVPTSTFAATDENGNPATSAKPLITDVRPLVQVSLSLAVDPGQFCDELGESYRTARKWQLHVRSKLVGMGGMMPISDEEAQEERIFDFIMDIFHSMHIGTGAGPSTEQLPVNSNAPRSAGLGSLPDAADELAAMEQGTHQLRVGTREEIAVRRLLKLARWTASAEKLADIIRRHREALAVHMVQGVAAASSNAKEEMAAAREQPAFYIGGIPLPDVLPQVDSDLTLPGLTPSSVSVVDNPSKITWEAFLSRRLAGLAAIVAAAYLSARPHHDYESDHAFEGNKPVVKDEGGSGEQSYRMEKEKALLMQESLPSSVTGSLPAWMHADLGSDTHVDMATLRAVVKAGEELITVTAKAGRPLADLLKQVDGQQDVDDFVDQDGPDDATDEGNPSKSLGAHVAKRRRLDGTSREKHGMMDSDDALLEEDGEASGGQEGIGSSEGEDSGKPGKRSRAQVRSGGRGSRGGASRSRGRGGVSRGRGRGGRATQAAMSVLRALSGNMKAGSDDEGSDTEADVDTTAARLMKMTAMVTRKGSKRSEQEVLFTATFGREAATDGALSLQAQVESRSALLRILQSEATSAEKWQNQAHSVMAASLPLSTALSLIATGFSIAVRMDTIPVLRKRVAGAEQCFMRAWRLIPPPGIGELRSSTLAVLSGGPGKRKGAGDDEVPSGSQYDWYGPHTAQLSEVSTLIAGRPTVADAEAAVAAIEAKNVEMPIVKQLKALCRLAHRWEDAARKILQTPGDPDQDRLRELHDASHFVWLDVSRTVSQLEAQCALRCVCQRLAVPGGMVACSTCGESFHRECMAHMLALESGAGAGAGRARTNVAKPFVCPCCAAQQGIAPVVHGAAQDVITLVNSTQGQPQVSAEGAIWLQNSLRSLLPPSFTEATQLRAGPHLRRLISACPPSDQQICQRIIRGLKALNWLWGVKPCLSSLRSEDEVHAALMSGKALFPAESSIVQYLFGAYQRTRTWRDAVRTMLHCRRGVPIFSVADIERRLREARRLPISVKEEEHQLEVVLADSARQWCVCQGFTRGFMVCCDVCADWYHGDCVGVVEADLAGGKPYRCATCAKHGGMAYEYPSAMIQCQEKISNRLGSPDIDAAMITFLRVSVGVPAGQKLPLAMPAPFPVGMNAVGSVLSMPLLGSLSTVSARQLSLQQSQDALAVMQARANALHLQPMDLSLTHGATMASLLSSFTGIPMLPQVATSSTSQLPGSTAGMVPHLVSASEFSKRRKVD